MRGMRENKNGTWINNRDIAKYFKIENQFKNEKEMCDYIELNMTPFCEELFHDEYVSHHREKRINSEPVFGHSQKRWKQTARVDFLIKCKNGTYCVEVKNPKKKSHDQSRTIGQMMMYHMELIKSGEKVKQVLVTSGYYPKFKEMVVFYGLDFDIYIFNKEHSLKL